MAMEPFANRFCLENIKINVQNFQDDKRSSDRNSVNSKEPSCNLGQNQQQSFEVNLPSAHPAGDTLGYIDTHSHCDANYRGIHTLIGLNTILKAFFN
jgi:hypothetical protein